MELMSFKFELVTLGKKTIANIGCAQTVSLLVTSCFLLFALGGVVVELLRDASACFMGVFGDSLLLSKKQLFHGNAFSGMVMSEGYSRR